MLESSAWSWALTTVFVLTGGLALSRLAGLASGALRHGSRLAELSHLVMSVAMVAMVRAWSGGPSSPSGVFQIVVFGALALCFLALTVRPGAGHDRAGWAYHLVTASAMVWMVAAMPLLVPGTATSGGGSGHAGHSGHPGAGSTSATDPAAGAAPPTWAVGVSVVLTVLLVAAVVLRAARALRGDRDRDDLPGGVTDPGPTSGTATATGAGAATTTLAPSPAVGRTSAGTDRTDTDGRVGAVCHALMSVGMAAMLVLVL